MGLINRLSTIVLLIVFVNNCKGTAENNLEEKVFIVYAQSPSSQLIKKATSHLKAKSLNLNIDNNSENYAQLIFPYTENPKTDHENVIIMTATAMIAEDSPTDNMDTTSTIFKVKNYTDSDSTTELPTTIFLTTDINTEIATTLPKDMAENYITTSENLETTEPITLTTLSNNKEAITSQMESTEARPTLPTNLLEISSSTEPATEPENKDIKSSRKPRLRARNTSFRKMNFNNRAAQNLFAPKEEKFFKKNFIKENIIIDESKTTKKPASKIFPRRSFYSRNKKPTTNPSEIIGDEFSGPIESTTAMHIKKNFNKGRYLSNLPRPRRIRLSDKSNINRKLSAN